MRAGEAAKPARQAYPSDLSEAAWRLIKPLVGQQRRIHDRREIVNALLCVPHHGCVWRVPPRYLPNGQTVSHDHRDWQDGGTWKRAAEPTVGGIDNQAVKTGVKRSYRWSSRRSALWTARETSP